MTLKELRKEIGLTQAQLAEAMNTRTRDVQRYEAETFSFDNMRMRSFRALSMALGKTMDELIDLLEETK